MASLWEALIGNQPQPSPEPPAPARPSLLEMLQSQQPQQAPQLSQLPQIGHGLYAMEPIMKFGQDISSMLPQKPTDQNHPLLWGLQDVIDRRAGMMRDPRINWGQEFGDKVRRGQRDLELDYLRQGMGFSYDGEPNI